MSSPALTSEFADIVYPESDGLPMADNTLQAFWMTFLFGGFRAMYRNQPDVFVAMNLFWYPVQGAPKIRSAPDVMIVLGRPKGHRGSYKQWMEENVVPQVAIEVLSPGNTPNELRDKLAWYELYGVQEYYVFDPDQQELTVYLRQDGQLVQQLIGEVWHSPLLDVQFDLRDHELRVIGSDGREFQSTEELTEENVELSAAIDEMTAERDAELDRLTAERDRLLEILRKAGIDPTT